MYVERGIHLIKGLYVTGTEHVFFLPMVDTVLGHIGLQHGRCVRDGTVDPSVRWRRKEMADNAWMDYRTAALNRIYHLFDHMDTKEAQVLTRDIDIDGLGVFAQGIDAIAALCDLTGCVGLFCFDPQNWTLCRADPAERPTLSMPWPLRWQRTSTSPTVRGAYDVDYQTCRRSERRWKLLKPTEHNRCLTI